MATAATMPTAHSALTMPRSARRPAPAPRPPTDDGPPLRGGRTARAPTTGSAGPVPTTASCTCSISDLLRSPTPSGVCVRPDAPGVS